MKKKWIALVLAFSLTAAFAGCGQESGETTESAEPASQQAEAADTKTETESAEEPEAAEGFSYTASDYVTLGDYENLKITVPAPTEITDEDVEAEMRLRLKQAGQNSYRTVDKDTVEMGDIVNIDYEGKKDGVAFQGGTAQDKKLTIGSGTFIDGFESGLEGAKVGDTVELHLTFPETYHKAELAGQAVVFTVKVKGIVEKAEVALEELTDDYVKEIFDANTVEVWKESVRQDLESEAESEYLSETNSAIMEALREICTVNGLPEGLVEERKKEAKEYYESQAEAYGVDLLTLLSAFYGTSEEELDQWIDDSIPQDVEDELILAAVAEDMGLDENSAAYTEYVNSIVENNGYASVEELYQSYAKDYVLRRFIHDEVLEELGEMATVNTESEESE